MSRKYTDFTHEQILKMLKEDHSILRKIYTGEVMWDKETIKKTVSDSLNITIDTSNDILMKRLSNFFNFEAEISISSF